jgi:hypothetical protein
MGITILPEFEGFHRDGAFVRVVAIGTAAAAAPIPMNTCPRRVHSVYLPPNWETSASP